MTSEFYRRVENVLGAVEDLEEGDRQAEFERLRGRALEDQGGGSAAGDGEEAVEAIDTVERWFALNPPVALRSQEVLADLLDPQDDPVRIGPYEILRRIGEGPLAVAFEALDVERNEAVALKLLRPGLPNVEFVEAFRHELPTLLICRHPNLARPLDVGLDDGGRAYLAQELVEGPNLERFCEQRDATLSERLELVAQLCDGLDYAHRRGHLHLGLTPRKVRVVASRESKTARACVLDLGVVSALSRGRLCTPATGSSPVPWAVAPEQVGFGNGALDLDLRADIYSVGAILYRLVAGRAPGETDGGPVSDDLDQRPSRRRLRRLLSEPTPPSEIYREATQTGDTDLPLPVNRSTVRTLERAVDAIALRALTLDRASRYQTMADLATDLRAVRPSGSMFASLPRPRSWMPFGR